MLVRNLFLCLPAPAFVAIVGHNGSGKTTLFRVLTGQLPYEGSIRLHGQEVRGLRRAAAGRLAGLPAAARQHWLCHSRARAGGDGPLPPPRPAECLCARAIMPWPTRPWHRVGMAHLAPRDFTQLSGGEQQLVWLAQLSLQDAAKYTCSTSPPSSSTCTTAARYSASCTPGPPKQGKTVLCSTHDLDNLPELTGYLLNLSEPDPQLRPHLGRYRAGRPRAGWNKRRNASLNEELRSEEVKNWEMKQKESELPHSSFLIPHSSFLIPHSSFLIPHSSFLIPHSSFLIPLPRLAPQLLARWTAETGRVQRSSSPANYLPTR